MNSTKDVVVWLFAAHFGWSWGPVPWILMAETWPLSTRPYGIALAASSNWMNTFIIGQVTPDMIKTLQWGMSSVFVLQQFPAHEKNHANILILLVGTFVFFGVLTFIVRV